ncbi:hypothetical protein U3516DRAFT_849441, partial [Neocallimastix sp. 'constans']
VTFIQFIRDISEKIQNIEVKFPLFEADRFISVLANEYNGYVFSNDSDFYIYNIPKYVNLNTLKFPTNIKDEDLIVECSYTTNDQILRLFNLPHKDILPLFGTICGNDYFNIDKYSNFSTFLLNGQHKSWNKTRNIKRGRCNFRKIVSSLLDIYEIINRKLYSNYKNDNILNPFNYDDLTLLQKKMIKEIFNIKPEEEDPEVEREFKMNLINSVLEYNLNHHKNKFLYTVDNSDESNENKNEKPILSYNKDLLKYYYKDLPFPKDLSIQIKNEYGDLSTEQLIKIFHLTKVTFPIFISLLNNEYLNNKKRYTSKFKDQFYSIIKKSPNRSDTNNINIDIIKDLIDFILNITENENINFIISNENGNGNNYGNLTSLQGKLIEEIVDTIYDNELTKFYFTIKIYLREDLTNSVEAYNKKLYSNKDNNEKKNKKASIPTIIKTYEGKSFTCNNKDIMNNILSLDTSVLENFYLGNFNPKVLNILINNYFKSIPFLENIDMESCWSVSQDLIREMIQLILKLDVNYENINITDSSSNTCEIKFYERIKDEVKIKEYNIDVTDTEDTSLNTNESRFEKYLTLFNSNLQNIKELPYYLIPVVVVLRYYIRYKSKINVFKYNKEDHLYSEINKNVVNDEKRKDNGVEGDKISESEPHTLLHSYELEALLASCISALTFSFLNKNNYSSFTKEINENENDDRENSFHSIKNNIKSNYIDCDNLYMVLINNETRSLQLKKEWTFHAMESVDELKNAIQIFAEFTSLLFVSSSLLQILRINHDFPEFKPFYSMYHYLWEEAFNCFIKPIKNSKNIKSVFNEIFKPDNNDDYMNYLEELYTKLLNIIVSN